MIERLERVVKAWAASRNHRGKEFTAERLLKTSKGELRAALNFTRNGRTATTPRALGNWLSNNRDTLAAGYYIRGRLDKKVKRYHWYLEKVSDDELRRLAYQDSLADRPRREPERQDSAPERVAVYVSPSSGADWWTREKDAEQAARLLNENHLNASVDYGPGGRCAVRVVDSTVREVTLVCRKIRALEFARVREMSEPPASQSTGEQKDMVFDPVLQKFVPVDNGAPAGLTYNPDARFIRDYQDPGRGGGPIPMRNRWSPFQSFGGAFNDSMPSRPRLVESQRSGWDNVLSSGFLPDGRSTWDNKGE